MINAININIQSKAHPNIPIKFTSSQNVNYTIFDQNKVNSYVSRKEDAIPELKQILKSSQNEAQIVETLYILDRMIDKGVKGIDKLYPEFSKFNQSKSPEIQTFLAGIYRKTQVPDGFGPLVSMLIKNSINADKTNNPKQQNFDPNEEIGGAILAYIENYSARKTKNGAKLDYQA